MRILIALEYFWPHAGGVETLFDTLATRLAAQGHAVRVLTMRLPGTKTHETRNGYIIERVGVPFDARTLASAWMLPALVRNARWADIVHTSMYHVAPGASIAGTLTRTPVIVTAHERIGRRAFSLPRLSWLGALGLYLLEHVAFRFPYARIAAVSEATKRDIVRGGIRAERVTRVYNFLDTTPWDPDALEERTSAIIEKRELESRTVIACYGRPGATKGLEYAVLAFPKIREAIPNATLLFICGSTPAAGKRIVERALDRVGRESVIELSDLPFKDLPAHVNCADVVVVPSLTEGFGFTTLESCLLGKKVVASRVGAIPEVVSGRYLLVEPKDPDAIASAVVSILKEPPEPEPAKRFESERMVERYLEEYERVRKK